MWSLKNFQKKIMICEQRFKLSFLVSHFVTYCLDENEWLKYDDTEHEVHIVLDEELVNPHLIFYIIDI